MIPLPQIFETMYATRVDGIRHYDRHERRLAASARELGFPLSLPVLRTLLADGLSQAPSGIPLRLRATLAPSGELECALTELPPLGAEPILLLASDLDLPAQSTANPFLGHKTTHRESYDQALTIAAGLGAFDVLFVNERGELTEGARSNIFLRCQGRWVTPPLSSGILPGIMRSLILEDPAWNASERVCTLTDLFAAEDLLVCNALRGPCQARARFRGRSGNE